MLSEPQLCLNSLATLPLGDLDKHLPFLDVVGFFPCYCLLWYLASTPGPCARMTNVCTLNHTPSSPAPMLYLVFCGHYNQASTSWPFTSGVSWLPPGLNCQLLPAPQ